MKKIILYLTAFILFFGMVSCGENDPVGGHEYPIEAPELVVSNPYPCMGEEVLFYYQSDISGIPEWDLGDGTDSSDAAVRHTYNTEGKYTVKLRFSDGSGGSVTVDTEIEVMGRMLVSELQELKNSGGYWYCAHRGHTYDGKKVSGIPENSIESILKCAGMGAQIVEIDLRTTSDGVLVLMHDATVNRTTNGNGQVATKTLEEIKALRLKNNNGTVTDCTIPTFEEALIAGRGKVFFNIDLAGRGCDIAQIARVVKENHMLERVLFYVSSNKEDAGIAYSVSTQCIMFPWVSSTTDVNYWTSNSRVKLLQMGYTAAAASSIVNLANTKGALCFTNSLDAADEAMLTGDYTEIDKITAAGVKVIQTDYVEKLKDYLEK